MIAFPKPDRVAQAGDRVRAEWNPAADPPRWEVVLPVVCPCGCCDCPCCDAELINVTITTADVYHCDEYDRLRREEGGGDVTVTP